MSGDGGWIYFHLAILAQGQVVANFLVLWHLFILGVWHPCLAHMAWPTDLQAFASLRACRALYHVSDEVWTSFVATAGDPGDDYRLLSAIPAKVFAATVEQTQLPDGTSLSVVQAAQLGLVYRLARRKQHVDAGLDLAMWTDPDPWAPTQAVSGTPVMATSGTPSTERRMKFTSILDQGDESEFTVANETQKQVWLMKYVNQTGGLPLEQEEPTVEQLSALTKKIQMGATPYADFSVFLPFGRKALRSYKYRSYIAQPDGSYLMREVPGPASFQQWITSYKVYKTALMMLDVISLATLNAYEAHVEKLSKLYEVAGAWHLVVAAEDQARAEHLLRLKVQTAMDVANGLPAPAKWDETNPWEAMFRLLIRDKEYWSEQVHIPANAWISLGAKGLPKTPAESLAAKAMRGGANVLRPDYEDLGKERSASPTARRSKHAVKRDARKRKAASDKEELERFRKQSNGPKGKDSGGKGKPQLCYAWNNNNGACAGLPPGAACQGKCGSPGHPSHLCTSKAS